MSIGLSAVKKLVCVVLVFKMLKSNKSCDQGWFGEKCRFKCRCAHSEPCDVDGSCPGKCEKRQFGPACQYVDATAYSLSQSGFYLIDENEETCNNVSNPTSVKIFWDEGIEFTWFRLHVNQQREIREFQVYINEKIPCPNARRFLVSDKTMDVTCDFPDLVKSLELTGKAVDHVCSIYVSGGRNVALKQETSQTSYFGIEGQSHPSNAVDGQRHPNKTHGNCTQTEKEPREPTWFLKFNRPYIITKITVYNNLKVNHRLKNFQLKTFNERGQVVYYYKDSNTGLKSEYDVHPPTGTPIVELRIFRTDPDPKGDKIIALCEVETMGEALCPDDYYGLWCNHRCVCPMSETCFTVTGACADGCHDGFYGFNCSYVCPVNCLNKQCYQRLGTCQACKLGYFGARCEQTCKPGTYGNNCSGTCSKFCLNNCNFTDGSCQCRPPYIGKTCSECPKPYFGDNCSQVCSTDCVGGECGIENGECQSCKGTRIGLFCQECPIGYFGPACYSGCSQYCLNISCHIDTGACGPCTDDFSGPNCTKAPPYFKLQYVFALSAVCCLILLTGGCSLLLKDNKHDDGTPSFFKVEYIFALSGLCSVILFIGVCLLLKKVKEYDYGSIEESTVTDSTRT